MAHHRRRRKPKPGVTLNIVSLVDVFTVLVFFLLLNSTELELLPQSPEIQLPESQAESPARETAVVMVSNDRILLQGRPVARVDEVLASPAPTIAALQAALQQLPPLPGEQPAADGSRELTVMGDREISYSLLRKVLATCAQTDFARLSLAVLQQAGPGGGAVPAQTLAGASR